MGCPDCHTAMHSLRLHRFLWIYYLGTPESVGMNRQIDWQAQYISHLGTVWRALGRLLRDGAERIWVFPSATIPS